MLTRKRKAESGADSAAGASKKKRYTVDVRQADSRDMWQVIDYLQQDIKEKQFAEPSFWFCMDDIADPNRLYCIWSDQELAGWMLFDPYDGEIRLLEVLPRFRRRGFGRKMVEEAVTQATNRSEASSIFIRHAKGSSDAFWAKVGFVDDGDRKVKKLA